jgi:hypothetical protein
MSVEQDTSVPVLDLRRRLETTEGTSGNGRDRAREPVSPELVLVDPELAARARRQLSDRVEEERPRDLPVEVDATPVERRRASKTTRVPRLGIAAIIAATLLAPGLSLLIRGDNAPTARRASADAQPARVRGEQRSASPSSASATAPARRSAPRSAQTAPARRSAPRRAAAPRSARAAVRTFVWVPVRGADAYEVQFFRGSRRVVLTRTTTPKLLLPGRSRGPGGRPALAPGVYRWYVWPLFRTSSTTRRGEAIVQAKLVVPREVR